MLTFKITECRQFIQLTDFTLNSERTSLFAYFKKKSKKGEFNVLVDRGIWDGKDPFITPDGKISIGLWREIYKFSSKYGYDCDIQDINSLLNNSISYTEYFTWVEDLLDGIVDEYGNPIIPRDYQLEGAYRALKYRFCCQELATSAGKTLNFYLYNSYLRDTGVITKDKKALIIVPNISLIGQTAEKFEMYAKPGKEWKIHMIGGKNKFNEDKWNSSELIISTYQSLQNLDFEIFKQVSVVCCDETHTTRGNVIREIVAACKNWQFKLGLSGTIKISEEYSDFFKIQETVGPLVLILPAKHLIDNNYSPNIKIKVVELEYDREDEYLQKYWHLKKTGKDMYRDAKTYGKEMLAIEKAFIFNNQDRLEFISKLTNKLNKNTLILFSDVKNGYGKKIQEELLKWNPNTFYIDGGIDSSDRDRFKYALENVSDITELTFGDALIKVNQYTEIPLTNGLFKLAKDITLDDDISNEWIEKYI